MLRSACLVLTFGALGALQPAVALAGIKPHCRDLTFAGAAGEPPPPHDKITLRVVDASGATLDESCQLQVQNNESARAFAARLVGAWGSGNGITCPPPPDPLPPKTCGNAAFGGKSCQHKFKFKPDKLTVDPDDGLIRVRICCKESLDCTGLALTNTPVSAQTKIDPAVVFAPVVPPPVGVTSTPIAIDPIGMTQRPHAELQGCRRDVGIAAGAAYPNLLRRAAECMDDIAAGRIPTGTCSPPLPTDPKLAEELANARQRVLAATESCGSTGSPPSEYGYGSCPPPCDTITIAGWSDVAACLNCQAETVIFGAIGAAYGLGGPAPGLSPEAQQCQAGIGLALAQLAHRLLLETRKCQEAGDKGKGALPVEVTCLNADPKGLKAVAEMKTQEWIQKYCLDTQAFVGLQTCGIDVPTVVACVTAQGHGVADKIATAVWPELHPGSPSGAFLEESGL